MERPAEKKRSMGRREGIEWRRMGRKKIKRRREGRGKGEDFEERDGRGEVRGKRKREGRGEVK